MQTANSETDFCCAKGTRLRGWAGSLTSRKMDKNSVSPPRLLMILEEKRFAGWRVPISRRPKKEMTCRWDISCLDPAEEKVMRSTILPARKTLLRCATRPKARGNPSRAANGEIGRASCRERV